jgi:hypothetical protein
VSRPKRLAAALLIAFAGGSIMAQPTSETPSTLAAMEGTWSVEQRTWAGPDAEPAEMPQRWPSAGWSRVAATLRRS